MNITTRKATLEDIEVLLLFEQGMIAAERPMDETLKREETYYYDISYLINEPSIELVIAEVDGKIAGCGYARIIKGRDCFQFNQFSYLGFMFTEEKYRGKGVNKVIIDYLYDWTLSKGVYEVRLEVYPDNPGAIRAYEKAGMKASMITMRIDLRK
ncbi:MAG: GNAT family N-acetyltransferase [Flavobacteriaceae bacterium]